MRAALLEKNQQPLVLVEDVDIQGVAAALSSSYDE